MARIAAIAQELAARHDTRKEAAAYRASWAKRRGRLSESS